MVSIVESSDDFLITILPVSASTASEKVKTILSLPPNPVEPSLGEEEESSADGFARFLHA